MARSTTAMALRSVGVDGSSPREHVLDSGEFLPGVGGQREIVVGVVVGLQKLPHGGVDRLRRLVRQRLGVDGAIEDVAEDQDVMVPVSAVVGVLAEIDQIALQPAPGTLRGALAETPHGGAKDLPADVRFQGLPCKDEPGVEVPLRGGSVENRRISDAQFMSQLSKGSCHLSLPPGLLGRSGRRACRDTSVCSHGQGFPETPRCGVDA